MTMWISPLVIRYEAYFIVKLRILTTSRLNQEISSVQHACQKDVRENPCQKYDVDTNSYEKYFVLCM